MNIENNRGSTSLPTVLVSAVALIDTDGRILLAQRPTGKEMSGLWEFPGGKVELGETNAYSRTIPPPPKKILFFFVHNYNH